VLGLLLLLVLVLLLVLGLNAQEVAALPARLHSTNTAQTRFPLCQYMSVPTSILCTLSVSCWR
jgi:hypothetical protein